MPAPRRRACRGFFGPAGITSRGIAIETVIRGYHAVVEAREAGLPADPVLCVMMSVESALETLQAALPYSVGYVHLKRRTKNEPRLAVLPVVTCEG